MKNIIIAGAGAILTCPSAFAAWSLIDNFEAYTPGDLTGQGSWQTANATGAIIASDPAGGSNQVLHRTGNGGASISTLSISDGSTATIFLRLRRESSSNDDVFGISDETNPNLGGSFGVFEAQTGVNGSNLRGRDGSSNQSPATLTADIWYNVWMVLDNSADSWRFFLQGNDGTFDTQTELLSTTSGDEDWDFRNGSASNDLVSFLAKSTNNGNTSVYYDDLYIDTSGVNLTVVPEPSAALLGTLGAIGLLRRRRD